MTLASESRLMLPAIEAELKRQVKRLDAPRTAVFHEMLTYHMGWTGAARASATGKRIRPLILLLACKSLGGDWRAALPAAAAVEIIHNFSLVHDDIQDNSPLRRGRPTLWKKHGAALAINAGDAFFSLANLAVFDCQRSVEAGTVLKAASVLEDACLDLTRGQFLDIYHQKRSTLSFEDYWEMIDGKTAALISAAAEMGALLAGASGEATRRYAEFGRLLGLAFQVQDDILGIWGKVAVTGKSASGDLAEGKLSLPVIYGLSRKGQFAQLWRASKDRGKAASRLRKLLQEEGAQEFARHESTRRTMRAIRVLTSLEVQDSAAGGALNELTLTLLTRDK